MHLIFCSLKERCQNSLPRCLRGRKLQLVSVPFLTLMFVFVHLTACHLLQGWEGGIPCFWTTSFCQQKVIQLGFNALLNTRWDDVNHLRSFSHHQAHPTTTPSPPPPPTHRSHLLWTAAFSVSGELGKVFSLLSFPISFWLQLLQFDICFDSWLGLYPVQALCSQFW